MRRSRKGIDRIENGVKLEACAAREKALIECIDRIENGVKLENGVTKKVLYTREHATRNNAHSDLGNRPT